MMFRKTGEKVRFWFRDSECIGMSCWSPGLFAHRGVTLSGTRNTGRSTPCCLRNASRGCPSGDIVYQIDLARGRKADGWRRV